MHDPMTVAFEIRYPWRRSMGSRLEPIWRYRPSFITIWHVDPERDGTDDSCGWGRPCLTKDQKATLTFLAGVEARTPWLLSERAKVPTSAADVEVKLRGALLDVARMLRVQLSHEKAGAMATELIHSSGDNIRSYLCFLPGWHTNFPVDDEENRKRAAEQVYLILASCLLRRQRPWWRHPRWHFWHWKFQVHPLQTFKRWAWGRCCKCGKGFAWGYCPVSNSWAGDGGPKWFRSEKSIYHANCTNPTVSGECEAS